MGERIHKLCLDSAALGQKRTTGKEADAFFRWLMCFEQKGTEEQWHMLNPVGTSFQKEVWRAVMKTGWGSRISYGALAGSIGRPKAARAVAAALAANPSALLIPCHRVISANGALGGYRWGRALKGKLLALEMEYGSWEAVLNVKSTT
jgi:O-6-methylguanine DNA methyltransferase